MFTVITVTSLKDDTLVHLKGNGTLDLREAIQLATHPNTNVDGYTNSSLTSTIPFDPSLDGKTINLLRTGDGSASPSAFGIVNGAQVTIDGETGLSKGITIARPQTVTIPVNGVPVTLKVPAFRLSIVQSTSELTLEGLTIVALLLRASMAAGATLRPPAAVAPAWAV